MTKEYNLDSEREYTAPETPRIVEPEPMIHKFPKWVKDTIPYLIGLYLAFNSSGFFLANGDRSEGISKSKIEERIDKRYSNKSGLIKFVFDDLAKPGRELAYLIRGDGEQEKWYKISLKSHSDFFF